MMRADLLSQAIGLEYRALALLAGPLTSLAVGWLLRQTRTRLRDRGAADYAARLVAWAQQAIPEKSARYVEVAALLSRRFPALSGEQLEVLIESEVHAIKTGLSYATPTASPFARPTAIAAAPPAAPSAPPTGTPGGTPGPSGTPAGMPPGPSTIPTGTPSATALPTTPNGTPAAVTRGFAPDTGMLPADAAPIVAAIRPADAASAVTLPTEQTVGAPIVTPPAPLGAVIG